MLESLRAQKFGGTGAFDDRDGRTCYVINEPEVTDDDIRKLGDEAAAAGDLDQAGI